MTKKHEEDAFERLSASARRIWLAGLGAIAEAEKRGDEIFESLRTDYRMPARTAWSIAIRVVVGGGSAKDAIYLRGITRILDLLADGGNLDVLLVGKFALDHIPLVQDLLDREVLHAPWVRPRWLDVPGAQDRLERLRAGATVTDLYEGDVAA